MFAVLLVDNLIYCLLIVSIHEVFFLAADGGHAQHYEKRHGSCFFAHNMLFKTLKLWFYFIKLFVADCVVLVFVFQVKNTNNMSIESCHYKIIIGKY